MRIVTERMKGRNVDVSDGIKVFDERGWAQVLPDPDEPLVHVYAEGRTEADGEALEAEFIGLVEEVVASEDEAEERPKPSSRG
jgi:mannose-1-phosphate guanylyltransferase/phosphomannomutase